ncbi:PQQ-binding-like beta-propeller repeat protein [Natrinema sp. 74]|uniref:outer membrane protein assembly factor BamB family protein n=1 Tax=Natrinema sp. 74 TaxID=3384159 RepID=UPI0038D38BCD
MVGSRGPFDDTPVLSGRDPETGDELWTVPGQTGRKSPIGTDKTFAYGFTKAAEAFAVDYRRGEVEWKVPIAPIDEADPGVVQFAPIPLGDRVVVPVSGTEDDIPDRLETFDRATGEHMFDHDLASSLAGAPATDGVAVLVSLLDGTLRRIAADGTEDWRVDLGTPVSDVTIADGTAYVGSPTEHLLAVDVATGDEQWRAPLENTLLTRPLVVGDRVFVGGADYYLAAFDRASGTRQWRTELANAVTFGPTVVGDRLVTLVGGAGRHRGPGGTVPSSPTVLYVHDTAGEQIRQYRFEGYLEGGSVMWAVATDDGVYLGQEWQLARLAQEVLNAE